MAAPTDFYSLETLAALVATKLEEWKCPCVVTVGARRPDLDLNVTDEARFEWSGKDTFEPQQQLGTGVTVPMGLLKEAAKVTIIGRALDGGADPVAHRRLVKSYVHSVVAAMLWQSRRTKIDIELVNGGFVDDERQEQEYGAKYEISFLVPETIFAAPWAKRSPPTTIAGTGFIVVNGVQTQVC